MFNFLKSKHNKEIGQKRCEILKAIERATAKGQCVILSETPEGIRIVLGKSLVQRQVEDILKSKGM